MDVRIVNNEKGYQPARLIQPTSLGYIHVAAKVHSSLPAKTREATKLVQRLKEWAEEMENYGFVESATIYKAVALPPLKRLPYVKDHLNSIHAARYDIVVLIETKSTLDIAKAQRTVTYQEMTNWLGEQAEEMHVIAAENAKRLNDVDKKTEGIFIFNYFTGENREVMLKLWDYLAGWYSTEMEIDNSTLFTPLKGEHSHYFAINHARLKFGAKQFLVKQMTKKSFWSFVHSNLEANQVGAMPIIYRMA